MARIQTILDDERDDGVLPSSLLPVTPSVWSRPRLGKHETTYSSLEPRLSILIFASRLWISKLQDKIRDGKPGFKATRTAEDKLSKSVHETSSGGVDGIPSVASTCYYHPVAWCCCLHFQKSWLLIPQSLPRTSPTSHDNARAQQGAVKFLPVYSLYFAHNFETVRNTQLFDATTYVFLFSMQTP